MKYIHAHTILLQFTYSLLPIVIEVIHVYIMLTEEGKNQEYILQSAFNWHKVIVVV